MQIDYSRCIYRVEVRADMAESVLKRGRAALMKVLQAADFQWVVAAARRRFARDAGSPR